MLPIEITLDRITIPAGRRAVDADAVERLKQSIAAVGLQHPITVCQRDGGYVLVAGAHRLAACSELEMQKIPANVADLNALEAELLEIDENLARNELSAAERTKAITRRKTIYEQLHPETQATSRGGDGRHKDTRRQLGDETVADRFTKVTAEATGRSERAIQRDAHRGEILGEEALVKIAQTSLDSGAELDALAKLPVAERQALVDRAAAGENVTAKPGAGGRGCSTEGPCARRRCIGGAGLVPKDRSQRRRWAFAKFSRRVRPRYRNGRLRCWAYRRRCYRQSECRYWGMATTLGFA